MQRSWTQWSLKVSSNPCNSVILWYILKTNKKHFFNALNNFIHFPVERFYVFFFLMLYTFLLFSLWVNWCEQSNFTLILRIHRSLTSLIWVKSLNANDLAQLLKSPYFSSLRNWRTLAVWKRNRTPGQLGILVPLQLCVVNADVIQTAKTDSNEQEHLTLLFFTAMCYC